MSPMVRATTRVGRRIFLLTSSAAVVSYGAALAGLIPTARAQSYGDLVPDPNGILDLPEGFTYRIVETAGDMMDDGYVVPERPDGMACFEDPDGNWVLMRNHEISAGDSGAGPYPDQAAPAEAYDPNGFGGVTRVVIDPRTGQRISSNLVLTGTVRNCAGGMSPWGWLTCEEDFSGSNEGNGHGYVFLCPITASSVVPPQRIVGYGRFNHEAACVDPATNICYLTEDRGDSSLYRFVPVDPEMPFQGRLQALKVVGTERFATTNMAVGAMVDVEWVDVADPNPALDTIRSTVQNELGAAIIVRGEGLWFHDGEVYVCSTSGGAGGRGQIFRLIDDPESPTLELIAMSTSADELEAPDNITVAPWGQLFMAEDGLLGDQYVRALTDTGEIVPFARNAASGSEFAGVCFSPDGSTMFVNIQSDGLTLAITGPFPEVPSEPGDGTGGGTGGGDGSADGDGGEGSGGSAATSAASGAGADGGSDGSGSSGGTPGAGETQGEGCGCDTSGGSASAVLAGAAALALKPRRTSSEGDSTDGDA